jgi:Protein of unknown function DUF262
MCRSTLGLAGGVTRSPSATGGAQTSFPGGWSFAQFGEVTRKKDEVHVSDIAIDESDTSAAEAATGVEDEDTSYTEAISDPFDPNLVRIDRDQPTIELLMTRIKEGEIDMQPDFQRKAGIWDNRTQSRLVESLLVRIPLPAFYFDATNDEHWLVVDGLQRLTTLKRFIVDKSLRLHDLEFLAHLTGKGFDDLSRPLQRRISETQVTAFTIQKNTPDTVKFTVFRRINTGGLPLSPQEIRHALNQGRAPKYLAELAESKHFKYATDYSIRDDRMADRECVLRFVAFTLNPYGSYRSKDFDEFLSTAMGTLNKLPELELRKMRDRFYAALRAARKLFGRFAFRKLPKASGRPPINKALFEVWTVNLARLDDEQLLKLEDRLPDLESSWSALLSDQGFEQAISVGTGNPARVRLRFSKVEDLIGRLLHD